MDFSKEHIIGGYKHKDGTKKVVERHTDKNNKVWHGVYRLGSIKGVQCYNMEGYILGDFLKDFLAAKENDIIKYRSKKYTVMTKEEVSALTSQGEYIEGWFR